MELEEMQSKWKSMEASIEGMETALTALESRSQRGVEAKVLGVLIREPIFELVVSILWMGWTGSFAYDHLSQIVAQPVGGIPVVLMHLMGLVTAGVSIRQIVLALGHDVSGSVLEFQKRVAAIRSLRVRSTQSMFLMGLALWVVFPVFAGQALLGFDLYRSVNLGWVVGNLAVGVAVAGVLILAAHRTQGRSRFFTWVEEVFAGGDVVRAKHMLAEVAAFEA